jgi:hypothetical protein
MTAHRSRWGRFTARGGADVEARIGTMMEEVAAALARALDEDALRAVVLLGGYGRGEGGVETWDGIERPHNNFDFLVVGRGSRAPDRAPVDAALAPLIARHGIGLDAGCLSEAALRRAPCLVMWHDMRFGHKTILGDPLFVSSLTRLSPERIVTSDVRDLIVNRGTLLVINQLLLDLPALTDLQRRTVVKHGVKAIIGYGDALLFFHGRYHWSYLEKQRRMRRLGDVTPELKRLYDEACELRLQPRYEDWRDRDLTAWNAELCDTLAPVHVACERRRLGMPELSLREYAEAAFRHALTDGTSARAATRKLFSLVRGPSPRASLGRLARLGYRAASVRERLSIVFPAVAYEVDVGDLASIAAEALGTADTDRRALRRAYLASWGVHGDTNFGQVLNRLGLDVAPPRVS